MFVLLFVLRDEVKVEHKLKGAFDFYPGPNGEECSLWVTNVNADVIQLSAQLLFCMVGSISALLTK